MSKKNSSKKAKQKPAKIEIDITKHELVPKHILLSEEEKKKLLKELGIKLSDLPRIKVSDPAIKHLNPKPGDIVKIIRKSPTAGEYIYYRVVVED
jgi:DNA-directed RNA polymerase subunit H